MFSRTITTLNIEADSIRLLSVKGGKVLRWDSRTLPPGLIRDTLIADPMAVASVIDELFDSIGASKKGVVVSLTGLRSVSRIVTLPKLRRSRMNEAVRWSARRELPMPLKDMHLSWQVFDHQDGEEVVFLVGTPRNIVEVIMEALWKAGIKPRTVDLKPLALARVVDRSEAIIIDLESESTSFLILVNGVPVIMHTMISPQEGMFLDDKVQKVMEDLSRALRFYDNAHPEQPVSPETTVFLTGDLASDHVVTELVQRGIKYAVKSPEPEVRYAPELPVQEYAVNIGLALGKMPRSKRDKANPDYSRRIGVNILPSEYCRRWWSIKGIFNRIKLLPLRGGTSHA